MEEHYHGHRKRIKAKFLVNPKSLADYEILEMLLFSAYPRKDTKPIAKELVKKFGSLAKVFAAGNEELGKIIGESAIASIKIISEASSRLLLAEAAAKPILNNWNKLLEYARTEMGNLKIEQFRILFVNSKNMLIADEIQAEGTINHTMAYPREVVKRALELSAASIILLHNHPSGDHSPSKADVELTSQIVVAANALGVKVHDHLIISESGHFSFKSNGLL
jgi:DNA repair protein RadC